MKKLIIIRHAKSSWEFDVIDHERPLNNRGSGDAKLVASALKIMDLNPDAILSSDAFRAKETATIFIITLGIDKAMLHLNNDLYDFSGENLLRVIKSCHSKYNELMVFGHNHAITAFVNIYGNKHIDNVPTSGVVIIEFDVNNWRDLKKGNTTKTVFPRDLKK